MTLRVGCTMLTSNPQDRTLNEVRATLGDQLGDLLFVIYILKLQPRTQEGVLQGEFKNDSRGDMLGCALSVKPLVDDLRTTLELETSKKKASVLQWEYCTNM